MGPTLWRMLWWLSRRHAARQGERPPKRPSRCGRRMERCVFVCGCCVWGGQGVVYCTRSCFCWLRSCCAVRGGVLSGGAVCNSVLDCVCLSCWLILLAAATTPTAAATHRSVGCWTSMTRRRRTQWLPLMLVRMGVYVCVGGVRGCLWGLSCCV